MVDVSERLKNAWAKWDIRVFVIVSLILQIVLVLFAPGRKRNPSRAFSFFVWSVYLLADWVATFNLGRLSGGSKNYNEDILAFWAPILLLHLGGPDTITALSVQDNELWSRHLIGLLLQVATAMYVFRLSIPNNKLLLPTLLIFVAGIIKYVERTYALYLASFDVFRQSVRDPSSSVNQMNTPTSNVAADVYQVRQSYRCFEECKGTIVGIPIFFSQTFVSVFTSKGAAELFQIMEYELGFLYDVLFTKASLIHTRAGYALRAICSGLIVGAFISFFFALKKQHRFSEKDIAITYVLLGGAICLDALAFVMLILSNWTIIKLENCKFDPIISGMIVKSLPRNRWSESIAQFNLLKACFSLHQSYLTRITNRPTLLGKLDELLFIRRFFELVGVDIGFEELRNTRFESLTPEMKDLILNCILDMESKDYKSLRGNGALNQSDQLKKVLYTVETEYGKSILMWHIATNLCYYDNEMTRSPSKHRKIAKLLSDYMMYVLVMRPNMVPSLSQNWPSLYNNICKHYRDKGILKRMAIDKKELPSEEFQLEACKILLSDLDVNGRKLDGQGWDAYDTSKAKVVDLDARMLAKILMKLGVNDGWETMSKVWIEMLCYAALHCPGSAHAQALTRGGELLTFIWFLLSNAGLEAEKLLDDVDKRNEFWTSAV